MLPAEQYYVLPLHRIIFAEIPLLGMALAESDHWIMPAVAA